MRWMIGLIGLVVLLSLAGGVEAIHPSVPAPAPGPVGPYCITDGYYGVYELYFVPATGNREIVVGSLYYGTNPVTEVLFIGGVKRQPDGQIGFSITYVYQGVNVTSLVALYHHRAGGSIHHYPADYEYLPYWGGLAQPAACP